jgi:hypothetical protein
MVIRSEQLQAMHVARVAQFENATVSRLYRVYPEIAGKIDAAFLTSFVRATILQAKNYKITEEQTLSQFLDYAFGAYLHVTGTGLVPWMDHLMSNLAVPASLRVDRLRLAILERIEQRPVS